MSKFFENLLNNHQTNAPKSVEDALYRKFKNAVSIDWFLKDDGYEAIFYEDQLEHIAQFDRNGKLTIYKINLPLNKLHTPLKQKARKHGKIMNVVEFHYNDHTRYEIIIHNEAAKRFLLHMDDEGNILEEKEL